MLKRAISRGVLCLSPYHTGRRQQANGRNGDATTGRTAKTNLISLEAGTVMGSYRQHDNDTDHRIPVW